MELPSVVGVLGLGVSGCAVTETLLKRGIQVIAADEKPMDKLANYQQVKNLAQEGAQIVLGENAFDKLKRWKLPLIIISPGISLMHPSVQKLRQVETQLWSEIELAYRLLPQKSSIIAVTGTKGKTTTVYLICRILEQCGQKVMLAGNVGKPFISVVDELADTVEKQSNTPVITLEVSSFQLSTCHMFRPDISALTVLFIDHLDWHGIVQDYWQAKAKLFANQQHSDWAVLNADDSGCYKMANQVRARIFWCGRNVFTTCPYCTHWVGFDDQFVWGAVGGDKFPILPISEFKLKGEHNKTNLAIAIGVSLLAGAVPDKIYSAVKDFWGIPHRLELVAEINGVLFINDSAATMPDASAAGLRSFDKPIVLIAGGRDKGGEWSNFVEAMREKVKALVVIGESSEHLMKLAKTANVSCLSKATEMNEAVNKAFDFAKIGDIVLLSPACASFDMFENYQQRGEAFKTAVLNLKVGKKCGS